MTGKQTQSSTTKQEQDALEPYEGFAKALADAQGEFGTVEKDAFNPYFKSRYASYAACEKAVRPALAKYGLSVVQSASLTAEGLLVIRTRIFHGSIWQDSEIMAKPKSLSPQDISACANYMRRIGFCMALGIVADEDDDGNATARKEAEAIARPASPYYPKPDAKFDQNDMVQDEFFYARLRANKIDESLWLDIRKKFIGQPWAALGKIVESVLKP